MSVPSDSHLHVCEKFRCLKFFDSRNHRNLDTHYLPSTYATADSRPSFTNNLITSFDTGSWGQLSGALSFGVRYS